MEREVRVEAEGEEEFELVLARASELKSKFFNLCITETSLEKQQNQYQHQHQQDEEDEDEDEALGLVNIRDAFDALEQQLSKLQTLQQQQRYEREANLLQIDHSRKILVSKLKEYKGDDLEVIREALTFAGGNSNTFDHDEHLLLPPYPTHLPPDLFVMDEVYPSSRIFNTAKDKLLAQNGTEEREQHHSCQPPCSSQGRNKPQGCVRIIFGLIAKSVLTFVGVASVLSLAGFKPTMLRDSTQFKIQVLIQRLGAGEKKERNAVGKERCPPGKVMVIEEGQPRCLVKERVEIPFDLDVAAPKINFGFG